MTIAARARKRKAKAPTKDYSAIARQFEEDVLARRFPACHLFQAAIERQRKDEASPPEGYEFWPDEGAKWCLRAERLPTPGEGPRRGKPFQLQPWQVWVMWVFFGWLDPVTLYPRFREASIWMPKGNGKTPLAAIMALCVLMVGKGGEKLYSAASAQQQARLVFDCAREILALDADDAKANGRTSIGDHFGLKCEEHRIRGARDARAYVPVSSEAGSIEGIRPYLLALDEIHVLPNRKLFDNLRSATNKVDGGRFIQISTAGLDMSPQSLGWNLYKRARSVLLGETDDPTLFALIIEADRKRPDGRDSDPLDIEVWREANPNMGVSVSVVGMQKAMRDWRDTPSERPSIEVKHLGWWQQSANAFLDVRRWNELADPDLSLDDLDPSQWEIIVGVDLARTRDLTAAPVVAAKWRDDRKREYRVFTRWTYLPEKSITLKQNKELRLWAEQGWLTLIPGETMSFRPLVANVLGLVEQFGAVRACVDEWMAGEVENDLREGGVRVFAVRQGAKTQSEPMGELEAAIMDGRLFHDGSPVAAMCIGNLRADRVGLDAIKPAREDETKKIDVAVAIINALVEAMGQDEDQQTGAMLM